MPKVISLFSDQEQATKAIEDLTAADIGEADIHTIESWSSDEPATPATIPVVNPNAGQGVGAVAPLPGGKYDLDLSSEEAEFFRRAVQNGGVLVVVDVEDEHLPLVQHNLQKRTSRIVSKN